MDSIIFQGNVIGMLMYIIPALMIFLFIINGLEDKLVERKLYLACGIGVVLGTIAELIMYVSGTDLHTEELGYSSMILVTPFILMMFLYRGTNLKTFRLEPAAAYSGGYGLFFGGTIEFWKLLLTESRYPDMSAGDFIIITFFGLASLLFLGGAAMWIAYAIKNENGIRIAGRLTILYLFFQYLYASALEYVHFGLHNLELVIGGLVAVFIVSSALFHQAYLRLPKIHS